MEPKNLNTFVSKILLIQVNHPLLGSFSVMVVKLVDLIKDLVSRGSVFEEEDFQPLVYGFGLCQVNPL
jgi:hypothetical protein